MIKNKLSTFAKFIAIATFVSIFLAITYLSYDSLMNSSYRQQNNLIVKSIDPNLDVAIFDQINQHRQYTESDLQFSAVSSSPSATP